MNLSKGVTAAVKAAVTLTDGSVMYLNKYLFTSIVECQERLRIHNMAINYYYQSLKDSDVIKGYVLFFKQDGTQNWIDPKSISQINYYYGEVL